MNKYLKYFLHNFFTMILGIIAWEIGGSFEKSEKPSKIYYEYDVYQNIIPVYDQNCIQGLSYCIDSFIYTTDTIAIDTVTMEDK